MMAGQLNITATARRSERERERERREHERREREINEKVARMMAAGKQIRAHLHEPITSDHGCLFDENGFPR
jgi:hypothetical protein